MTKDEAIKKIREAIKYVSKYGVYDCDGKSMPSDGIKVIKTALEHFELAVQEAYQPIESAPRDGMEVFLVTGETEQPCVVTRSSKNWRDTGYPFAAYHSGIVFHESKFSHWKPLEPASEKVVQEFMEGEV